MGHVQWLKHGGSTGLIPMTLHWSMFSLLGAETTCTALPDACPCPDLPPLHPPPPQSPTLGLSRPMGPFPTAAGFGVGQHGGRQHVHWAMRVTPVLYLPPHNPPATGKLGILLAGGHQRNGTAG